MTNSGSFGPQENASPAWAQGFADRLKAFERQENPYLNAADEREDLWDDGWLYADAEIIRGRLSAGKDEKAS